MTGLSTREAVGLLVMLWCHVADQCDDGDLSNEDTEDLAEALRMPPEEVVPILDAMVEVGFLDANVRNSDGFSGTESDSEVCYSVHDWTDHYSLKDQREARAESRRKPKRTKRVTRRRQSVRGQSADSRQTVNGESPDSQQTVALRESRERRERRGEETRVRASPDHLDDDHNAASGDAPDPDSGEPVTTGPEPGSGDLPFELPEPDDQGRYSSPLILCGPDHITWLRGLLSDYGVDKPTLEALLDDAATAFERKVRDGVMEPRGVPGCKQWVRNYIEIEIKKRDARVFAEAGRRATEGA